MKYQKAMSAVMAFLMVGVNLGGAVRVFADEINTNTGGAEMSQVAAEEEETPNEGDKAGVLGTESGAANEGTEDTTTTNENTVEKSAEGTAEPQIQLRAAALPTVASAEPTANEEPVILRAAPVPTEDGDTAAGNRFLAEVGDKVEFQIEGINSQWTTRQSCRVNGVNGGSEEAGATCVITDGGSMTVEATGVYEVSYAWCNWAMYGQCYAWGNYSATVVAYDVAADLEGSVLSEDDMAAVVNFVTVELRDLIETGKEVDDAGRMILYNSSTTYPEAELSTWDFIWSALLDNQHFTVKATMSESLYMEASDKIDAQIKDSETVAAAYDGYILVNVGEKEVGEVYALDTPVNMNIDIPAEYATAPAGYTRNFEVIRGHEPIYGMGDPVAERMGATRDGDTLAFQNALFSTFVVVYEDVADGSAVSAGAPNTGAMTRVDEAASSDFALVTLAGAVAVLAFGAVQFAKRR